MLQSQEGAQLTMTSDEETSLVRTDSLDQRLVLSPSERNLPEKEFLDLIALADSLRQFDERKGDKAVLDAVEGTLVHEGNFPVSVAYEVAQSLGISADYMERAIALRYPTVEQQFADIYDHGAIPSFGAIIKTYGNVLIDSVRSSLPTDKFDLDTYKRGYDAIDGDGYVRIYHIHETRHEGRFLFWKTERVEKNRKQIVDLDFFSSRYKSVPSGKFVLHVQVKDPLFLRACGDSLKELNKHFEEHLREGPKVFYHYVVE